LALTGVAGVLDMQIYKSKIEVEVIKKRISCEREK
jgi:hypothetical protein